MYDASKYANLFDLRAEGYKLAADVARELMNRDGADATLIRECEPEIRVAESGASGSTYVYLDSVKSRISDHPGGAAGEISERLDATEMVDRWIADLRGEG